MVEQRLALRNRVIGATLRDARERAGKTKRVCAQALGVSINAFTALEEGKKPISLPELEILAYVLKVPIKMFWDPVRDGDEEQESDLPLDEVLPLRHRIVGALLRQARLDKGLSQSQLAEILGCSSGRIAAFEYGDQAIPVAELEVLAEHLEVPLKVFLDSDTGPVAEWHWRAEVQHSFGQLPREIQEFATRPANVKYLEVAMRLSHMDAAKLRGIAEGLLDITY